jgi:hypothetical protein
MTAWICSGRWKFTPGEAEAKLKIDLGLVGSTPGRWLSIFEGDLVYVGAGLQLVLKAASALSRCCSDIAFFNLITAAAPQPA